MKIDLKIIKIWGKYMKSTTKQVLHVKLINKIYWILIIGGYLAP